MISVKSVKNFGGVDKYDEVWVIVRSLKTPIAGAKQVEDLAPSRDLFLKYLELKKNNKWNADAFKNIYLPQFLYEIKANSKVTSPLLNELWRKDKEGKNIALLCFCDDEELCHRSIVAGLLQGVGCTVSAKADYSRYYEAYKEL